MTKHANCTHESTPAARAACRKATAAKLDAIMQEMTVDAFPRTHEERFDAAVAEVKANPAAGAARSRAKTNEYRALTLKVKKLPKCKKCNSHRFDSEVTGPDVDAMCGPTYCHYALEN